MDKIVFENGRVVSSGYLAEVQKGTKFTGADREDFYTQPTSGEEAGWDIGERDSIKDWEIADPRTNPGTGIGRLAHDGIVLGPETIAVSGGIGVRVEAGSVITRSGQPLSWPQQSIQILGGASSTSYIYLDEAVGLAASPVTLSIANSLPSVTTPHIPLAKIVLNTTGDGLATDPLSGQVVGTGYVDLRPHTFLGALNTYPQSLLNTELKSDNYTAKVFDRVLADTSNGSFVITLPTDPEDSDRFAIVDISGSFDRFPIIIRPGAEPLNNSGDDWIVNIRDSHLELFYSEEVGYWKFEQAPGSECNPVLGSFLSCGGREFIGDRSAVECPDGQALPNQYPELSAGTYSFEPSLSTPTVGKCYKVYNNTVALFANGTGGLISIPSAPRCDRSGVLNTSAFRRNTIYIDGTIGDDSIDNDGFSIDKPFRTIERAILDGVRSSRNSYDRITLHIASGDYYVDNYPGSLSPPSPTTSTGLLQRTGTGLTVSSVTHTSEFTNIIVNTGVVNSNQPPLALNLGRVLYTQTNSVGTITRIEKLSPSSSNWRVTLSYVKGSFAQNDELFYDNLGVVNPVSGGIVIPRGMSVDGENLRKVRIRPMYVPELTPGQNNPQLEKTAIFKVTGGVHVTELTFTDNLQYSRTHNTVTSVTFASQAEINGSPSNTSYYAKINSLFGAIDNWGDEGISPLAAETVIVAPLANSKASRGQDLEQNQTGIATPDSLTPSPVSYPGPTRLVNSEGQIVPLPDINSTRSSSPYIFNCSVRSIFGLNGMWVEGSKVSGFRSMVTANFTQVSLQTDPNCFLPTTYFQDPPTNKESGEGKQYLPCSSDTFKYRHFGIRGSNDATIQIVSVFVIGNADHFVCEDGADLSITNSCSDFGDISLRAIGYKQSAFSQDEATTAPGYSGTRITRIIPPLPLSYSPLADGRPATLEDIEISTGLTIDYAKTLAYVVANKTPANLPPSTLRVYVQNSNAASVLSLDRPPSAKDIAFGQYSFTRKLTDTSWELSGGARENRKRLYVNGFDERGESILYCGDIRLADQSSLGFNNLDDSSKVFVWDPQAEELDPDNNLVPAGPAWYIELDTSNIVEEEQDLDNDGFLLKKLDYAFRYKLLPNPTSTEQVFASLDFVFERSGLKIIRALDKRLSEDTIYKVVLEGFIKEQRGLRRPQPYYVLEKQQGVAGFPLNGSAELSSDPLTLSQVLDTEIPGTYTAYLTQGSKARDVFTGDIFPARNSDNPEASEDPLESATRVAMDLMRSRPGVNFSAPLGASVVPITLKTSASATSPGIRIGLRRPSVIRASGHTWEWTGYLNYDTAFPTFQGDPLDQDYALGKILVEEKGGRVYATGMNEEGNYYLGTTVFDLRSGEQFAIPLGSDTEVGTVTNQVLNNVIVRTTLLMQDGSSLVMGRGTTLFFSNDTELKSLTSGDITASRNPPAVYANTAKAGLVQLASPEMIRGARGSSALGISDKVAVTAFDLANELDVRFSNSVGGSDGITVTQTTVELPGGDVNDPSDNITQFTINLGLPLNSDNVAFAGLRLGATNGLLATTISSAVNKSAARPGALVTESALRLYQVGTDQIEEGSILTNRLVDGAVSTAKLADSAVSGAKLLDGSVTEGKIANGSVTVNKLGAGSVTGEKIQAGAVSASKLNGGQHGDAPVYGVRAWGLVNVDAPSGVSYGGNLTSASASGADWTVHFTTPMPTTHYSVTFGIESDNDHIAQVTSRSVSSFTFRTFDAGEGNDTPGATSRLHVMVIC